MADIFSHSKIRLSQAKRHIVKLKSVIKTFLEDYAIKAHVIEDDPSDSRYVLHKIKITEPPSEEIIAFTVDAIDNLRATLDLAWWNLAATADFIPSNAEALFPFADNVTKFGRICRLGLKKFSQEIISLLVEFKPHKGGDDLLWALNRICATNKHRLLPLKIIRFRQIDGQITKWGDAEVPVDMGWNDRNNEIVILRAHRHTITETHINLSLDIAFDKSVEVIGGKQVLTVLNTLANKVENILEALEGAAITLGIIP